MMKKIRLQLTRLLLLCPVLFWSMTPSAGAHEFWIEPVNWAAAPGEDVLLSLLVGTGFKGNGVPDLPRDQLRFDIVTPTGATKPAGRGFAADPAGKMVMIGPGVWRAVYQNKGKKTTLMLSKFLPYLQESGLKPEYEALKDKPSLWKYDEEFRRNAVYLSVQDDQGDWPLKPAGLHLELVPQNNPQALAAGEDFTLQVLWKGEPLAGRLVYVLKKGMGEKRLAEAWTDQQGMVSLPIGKAGQVLINIVQMQKKRFADRSYISDWSSLTINMR